MGKIIKKKVPPIGLRIIKSSVAVALCYVVTLLRGSAGSVFYSQLAALWCIQTYVEYSWKNAIQRFVGTTIGAIYGLIFILGWTQIQKKIGSNELVFGAIISIMIIAVLYTTIIIKKKQASYFSCVVFLSITVMHIGDLNPYLFVWNRFLDTMIGIAIGVGVNAFTIHRKKDKETLFVAEVDDVLGEENVLSDYSRIELNRMLREGVKFTLATGRTPATLIEAMRDVNLNLPVIAMGGAALYDIKEKRYLNVYVVSYARTERIHSIAKRRNISCFVNVIVDDMLVIYYEKSDDPVLQKMVEVMRRSPYRNYVQRKFPETNEVAYVMILDKREKVEGLYEELEREGMTKSQKVLMYDSHDYPGYTYIKIYNKNASKENMICYLKGIVGIEKEIMLKNSKGKFPDHREFALKQKRNIWTNVH